MVTDSSVVLLVSKVNKMYAFVKFVIEYIMSNHVYSLICDIVMETLSFCHEGSILCVH